MSRVVVTGGTGFVAANLIRRLAADGVEVIAGVSAGADIWRLADIRHSIECVETDVRDESSVATLLARTRPDRIYHLAAHGAYSWQRQRDVIFATNFTGTVNVLESALRHGVSRVVVAGSSSEYGYQDHAPNESEAPKPNSDYAVAKAAATLFAGHIGRTEPIGVTVLRLYSVYGPWEDPRRLVPALVAAALAGSLPPLVAPDVARDFVFVDDVCDAFVRAGNASAPVSDGAIYNVGSGRQTSLAEIVEIVRRRFNIEALPQWGSMESRVWDTNVWVADPARAAHDLGWVPLRSLEDGLIAMAEWLERSPELRLRYGLPDG